MHHDEERSRERFARLCELVSQRRREAGHIPTCGHEEERCPTCDDALECARLIRGGDDEPE